MRWKPLSKETEDKEKKPVEKPKEVKKEKKVEEKKPEPKKPKPRVQRIKLSDQVTLVTYDTLIELQRLHRRATGKHLPRWKILDAAIIAYAEQQGIKVGE